MKYMKMLGLLAVAAAALMAFAGTASATVTDGTTKTAYTGDIHATSTNSTLHGAVTIECKKSTVSGSVSKGATTGNITQLDFEECNHTVSVVKKGSLTVQSDGTLFSTGAEVTVITHTELFGSPVTAHCVYKTDNTHIGKLTEGTDAVLHIGSAAIPRVTTDAFCGSTSTWTGSYTVDTPHILEID